MFRKIFFAMSNIVLLPNTTLARLHFCESACTWNPLVDCQKNQVPVPIWKNPHNSGLVTNPKVGYRAFEYWFDSVGTTRNVGLHPPNQITSRDRSWCLRVARADLIADSEIYEKFTYVPKFLLPSGFSESVGAVGRNFGRRVRFLLGT